MRKIESIKSAAMINAAAKYSNVFFNLIATAILARVLSAEDFGIVAVIVVFTNFFALLSDMGLGAGVIQNKGLSQEDINNIFSFTFYLALLLMGIFIICSWPISWFYKNAVYVPIGGMLSISVFFNTLNMIPNAKLLRDKQFLLIGIRTVVVALGSYFCTVLLALLGWGYYALVFQSVSASFFHFIFDYYHSGIRLKFTFSFKSVKKILGYSFYHFGYDLLNYFGRNLDNLLTGKFFGPVALGYYSKGYNLMLYPVNYLTYVITPALHPILSEHQNNKRYIYDTYIRVFKVLSLLGTYISVFCFFSSKEIVLIFYGEKWAEVIPCIQYLSLSIWFQMTASSCTGIFKSLGNTRLRFLSGAIYVPIQIICIIIGIFRGNIVSVSFWVSFSLIIRFFIEYYFLVKKAFGYTLWDFYKMLRSEAIITIVLIVMFMGIKYIEIQKVWCSVLFKGVLTGTMFVFLLYRLKEINYFLELLPKKLRNKKI